MPAVTSRASLPLSLTTLTRHCTPSMTCDHDVPARSVTCEGGACVSGVSKDICWLTRASGCREMCTAGREHTAAIWRPCDCARVLLGHAGRIGVRVQRSESGRGAMAARAATAAAATRAGRTLRIERAGRRGHGPMRARRAWAAASMPQSRAKYARRRRVLRRAAAAYGVVYLAFYSARDVQTLTNQRGAQRLEMVH